MSFPDSIPQNAFVLDVEAGGLDPTRHSIIEIGIVHLASGDYYSTYIREGELFLTPEAEAIHGITEETILENGLPPATVAVNLLEFLADCAPGVKRYTMIGFNVSFDAAMVRRLFRMGGESYPFCHRTVDLHSVAYVLKMKGLLPAKLSSDALFRHYGIEFKGDRHQALGDTLATAELFTKLLERIR